MINPADLAKLKISHKALISNLQRAVDTEINIAAETAIFEAQHSLDFVNRTGRLIKGFTKKFIRTRSGTLVQIENKEPHAAILDTEGAAPHVIEARNASFLRFMKGGVIYFLRRVNHPGVKPTFFVKNATIQAFARFSTNLTRNVNRITEAFNRNRF